MAEVGEAFLGGDAHRDDGGNLGMRGEVVQSFDLFGVESEHGTGGKPMGLGGKEKEAHEAIALGSAPPVEIGF